LHQPRTLWAGGSGSTGSVTAFGTTWLRAARAEAHAGAFPHCGIGAGPVSMSPRGLAAARPLARTPARGAASDRRGQRRPDRASRIRHGGRAKRGSFEQQEAREGWPGAPPPATPGARTRRPAVVHARD
jgi:hypothetical protein